jgi:hypothetical protein
MTCNHFCVDEDSAACGHCKDEWYIGTPFDLNGHAYEIMSYYGMDTITQEDTYKCRRIDGGGTVYLDTDTLDQHIGQPRIDLIQIDEV